MNTASAMWKKLVDITMQQNQRNYDRLNVTLTEKDVMGESLYNPMLPAIVEDLKAQGLAVEDDGALVVYLDEFKNKDGDPMGVIVQKKMVDFYTPPQTSLPPNIVMKP